MLEQLFPVLRDARDLPLEQRGMVAMANSSGEYFQVAQFGMEPAWNSDAFGPTLSFGDAAVLQGSPIRSSMLDDPAAPGGKWQLLLLPLNGEGTHLGYLALFTPTTYRLPANHLDFFTGLSHALSGFVQRILAGEILRVYEYELKEARTQAIQSLSVASEYRDNETGWHIMRMANYTLAIAKALGLSEAQKELLYAAAPMHDVGKLGIADSILLKRDKLTPEEFSVMKTHTTIGVSILAGNDVLMAAARSIAGAHHERWNGEGYPAGLAGERIHLMARICAVADVFDALTATRPYKKAWPLEEAIDLIVSESGKSFDPAVVRAFEVALPEILRIRELYRDDIIDPNKSVALPPLPQRADSWIAWDGSLDIGIDAIDEHHRYLFDLINDLFEAVSKKCGSPEVAKLIKAAMMYAKVHFRTEEKMMQHYGYEDVHRHEQQHHAFEAKAYEFYEGMHVNPLVTQFNALTYLRDWLIHHICIEDIKLKSLVGTRC